MTFTKRDRRVLLNGRRKQESQSQARREVRVKALKMEGGHGEGMRTASRRRKRQGTYFPLKSLEGRQPCQRLEFICKQVSNSNGGRGGSPTHHQAILRHQQGVWEYSSILHFLPGDSIKFHRLKVWSYKTVPPFPASAASHKSQLLPKLLTLQLQTGSSNNPLQLWIPVASPCGYLSWLVGCRLEFTITSFLGSTNLLKMLVGFRETFYLLGHWFIIQGYKPGAVR